MEKTATLVLPNSITGKVDVSRLLRELGELDEQLLAEHIKHKNQKAHAPGLSMLLEALEKANKLDLAEKEQRDTVMQQLTDIREKAPNVQLSFASNPSAPMIEKLVQWFRKEAHPHTLIQQGLQPNLAAGCILRSPNRVFDLSLKKKLAEQRPLLIEAIKTGETKKVEPLAVPNNDTETNVAPEQETQHE